MYRTQHHPAPSGRPGGRRLAPWARAALVVAVLLVLAAGALGALYLYGTSQCSAFGGSCP